MTAETDLLPMPYDLAHLTSTDEDRVEAYARANVAHAIAPLQAEIEALRAELGCLQQQYDERTACVIVHRGSALSCSDAVRSAYSDEHHRADKLAEALRDLEVCANTADYCYSRRPSNFASALVELRESAEKARALLRDQEEGE